MRHENCISRLWWVLSNNRLSSSMVVVSRKVNRTILYGGIIGSYTRKMTIERVICVTRFSGLLGIFRRVSLVAIFDWLSCRHVWIREIDHISLNVHVFWFSLRIDKRGISVMILNIIQVLKLNVFRVLDFLALHSCPLLFPRDLALGHLLILSFLFTEYLRTQRLNLESLVYFMGIARGIVLIVLLSRQLIPKSFKFLSLTFLIRVITSTLIYLLLCLIS